MSSLKSKLFRMSAIALIAGNSFSGMAIAADMLGEPVFEEAVTEVEFGTGWYIRGDLGVSSELEYGDAAFGNAVSISAGAGYMLGNKARVEVLVNQFSNLQGGENNGVDCGDETIVQQVTIGSAVVNQSVDVPITGSCSLSVDANPYVTSFMANGYYDFDGWYGIRPYVGAGLGVAFVAWGDVTQTSYCVGEADEDCGQSGGTGYNEMTSSTYSNDGQLAASLNFMLGASYKVGENMHLDAGYRYTMVTAIDDYQGNEGDAMHLNEFRLGLRYEIW